MVDCAREVGADAVAHGCTGKGNDQVFHFWPLRFSYCMDEVLFA